MKALLQSFILALTVSVIFISCSHQNSITKRRYMKGYHINHNHTREGLASTKQQSKKIDIKPQAESLSLKQEDIKKEEPAKDGLIAENNIVTKNNERKSFSHLSNISKVPFGIVTMPKISTPEKLFNSLSKDKTFAAQPDPVRATLSLLWILILALLIVYVIGLLADGFGLGWVIHVLAVVVVVLLILWLLRLL